SKEIRIIDRHQLSNARALTSYEQTLTRAIKYATDTISTFVEYLQYWSPLVVPLRATCGLGSFRHVPIHMTKGVPHYGTQNSSEVSPRTSRSRAVSPRDRCGAWYLAQ